MTQPRKRPRTARRKAAAASLGQIASSPVAHRIARSVAAGTANSIAQLSASADVSVTTLPPYRMGPYQLRIVAATREMFADKRRKVEADWNAGIVHIRRDANESRALSLLTRHLITAIHYRSGLNDASDEESYAHSCASGLVELALGQREFFVEFLALLEKLIKPGAGWRDVYLNGRAVAAPKRIVCASRACTIRFVASESCSKAEAYGFYIVGKGVIELSDKLSGANLALVALHEKLHFMHECAGLKDKSTEAMFKNAQSKLLLGSLKDNPGYWRWWLSLLSHGAG